MNTGSALNYNFEIASELAEGSSCLVGLFRKSLRPRLP